MIVEGLMCKWLGKTPNEIRKMPYEDRTKLEMVYQSFIQEKPELLM